MRQTEGQPQRRRVKEGRWYNSIKKSKKGRHEERRVIVEKLTQQIWVRFVVKCSNLVYLGFPLQLEKFLKYSPDKKIAGSFVFTSTPDLNYPVTAEEHLRRKYQ